MTDQNFSETQRRLDLGLVTEGEAYRHGSTHRAYGWACNPPAQWALNLRTAYIAGYHGWERGGRETFRIGNFQAVKDGSTWAVFYYGSCIESGLGSEAAARQFITDRSTSK